MKLAGFLVLLAVIFFAAHAAGVRFGPVSTSHSRVQYTGGATGGSGTTVNTGSGTGGMNMSGSP
jgi:hypothetical protein